MTGRHNMPKSMTARARWYLVIAAIRHLTIAVLAIGFPWSFRSPNFEPIKETAPLFMWGVVFAGAGLVCVAGAWTKRSRVARLGLMLSATSTLMAAVGFILALFDGGEFIAPIGAIVFTAVAAKDFTVCADPLRSPFEDWAEEVVDQMDKQDERIDDARLAREERELG